MRFKLCTNCHTEKPIEKFGKDSGKKDGLSSRCKDCAKAYLADYYSKNKERLLVANKKWRDENSDKIKRYTQEKYYANPEAAVAKTLDWQRRNTEKYLKKSREWRINNPEKSKAISDRRYEKRRDDISFRINSAVSAGIRARMKRGAKGGKRSFDLLPYTIDELMTHLERQFINGMAWDNYGKWHIDHILPLASFNIDNVDCDDFTAAWSLCNLRPLWAVDNLKKKDKVLSLI